MRAIILGMAFLSSLCAQAFIPGNCLSGVHGDQQEDDFLGVVPMLAHAAQFISDTSASLASGANVGAVSNCYQFAVMYQDGNTSGGACPGGSACTSPVTVFYTPAANGTYTSCNTGTLGTNPAHSMVSNPLIGSDGSFIVADEKYIARLSSTCSIIWETLLPYYGVPTAMSSSGYYHAGSIKYFADTGNIGIATVGLTANGASGSGGPLALFNGSTGAIIGPAGCNATNGTCATWPGVSGSPGVIPSATNDYWIAGKEGGAVLCGTPTAGACTLYKALQWSCTGATNPPSGSCASGNYATLGAFAETAGGLVQSYLAPVFQVGSYASPMAQSIGGNAYVFTDQASVNSPANLIAAMVVYQDTGAALTPAPGFPLLNSTIAASGAAQASASWTVTSGSPNTVTFAVSNTSLFSTSGNAYVSGTSQSGLNTNWAVTAKVTNTSVTVSTGTTLFSACSSGCGTVTLLANIAGPYHANFAWDPVNNCAINYMVGQPAFYCVNLSGTTVYKIPTGSGFISGIGSLVGVSDRDIGINPANGHSVMITALNSSGLCYMVLIDLSTQALLCSWPIPSAYGLAEGQTPCADIIGTTTPICMFSTSLGGMIALGPGGTSIAPGATVSAKVTIQ